MITSLSIPLGVRLLALVASLLYVWAVVVALRGSHMNVKQSLLWFASGVFFLFASLFPDPLVHLGSWVGFVAPSNAAFVVWLLVLTMLLFYQSLTTSQHTAHIKTLTQELALLRAERGEDQKAPGGTP